MKYDRISETAAARTAGLRENNAAIVYISASGTLPEAPDILDVFRRETDKHRVPARVIRTGSSGYYDLEPLVRIDKPGSPSVLFRNVAPETAIAIINEYLVKNNPVLECTLGSSGNGKVDGIPDIGELPLFSVQERVALQNCGRIDPEDIDHYIALANGFSSLDRALRMRPEEVISGIESSGLRGKGGAGYPAAYKWRICHDAGAGEKFVVCNAVDADPDSLTAGLILESDPYSVLEGTLIAAYAVGASRCFICISERNKSRRKRIEEALARMKEYGLVGEHILDSGFSAIIEVREVPASFIMGEETALIRFLEGKQPMPYLRTDYPAVSGINGNPTLVHSLETLSCVPAILRHGAEWYRSHGTKVITLAGNIKHAYTVEVPFGTTVRSVVENIGGGTPDGGTVRAVRFGGPAGCIFDAASLDTGIDYESIKKAGAAIGSGVVRVFSEDFCAVETARDAFDYIQSASCGKCVFCREGSLQVYEILKSLSETGGKAGDLDLAIELCEAMKEGSICGLGAAAPDVLMSSIRLFRDDFEAHIRNRKCPAFV